MRIPDNLLWKGVAVALLLLGGSLACAIGPSAKPPDAQSIAALEARIPHASPREQCYLYAELLHQMTELSLRQYALGNVAEAGALLLRVQETTTRLREAIAQRDSHLREAEILLRHAAVRLTEMLHASSYEDRPLVEQTLAQVNLAQNATLMQVFRSY